MTPAGNASVAVFGTLLDPQMRNIVFGRAVETETVELRGRRVALVSCSGLPALVEASDAIAQGLLLSDLNADDMARIDYFEAVDGYERQPVVVQTERAPVETQIYLPAVAPKNICDASWSLSAWQAATGPLARAAAAEIMRMRGQYTPPQVGDRLSVIRTRAQAHVNARSMRPPLTLRSDLRDTDVEVVEQNLVFSEFFSFEDILLRHRLFEGRMGPEVRRGVLMSADAVTVLPYDPIRDRVLLVEQFRAALYLRGDPHPWGLEAVAGRIDPGETPEETAHREAREEAGLTLGALHLVGRYYAAPGSNTEFLHSYVAECDLPDDAGGLGGLEAEAEDIRALVVPWEALVTAVKSGEVNIGPLLTSALWLKGERARLRESAGGRTG